MNYKNYSIYDNNTIDSQAVKYGNTEIFLWLLKLGVNNYELISSSEAEGGNIDINKNMLTLGEKNYIDITTNSALNGNKEILKFIIDNYQVNNYLFIASYASNNNKYDIVKWMIELVFKSKNDYKSDEEYITMLNEIVELMIKYGAKNYNGIAKNAAMGGCLDIVKWRIEDYKVNN